MKENWVLSALTQPTAHKREYRFKKGNKKNPNLYTTKHQGKQENTVEKIHIEYENHDTEIGKRKPKYDHSTIQAVIDDINEKEHNYAFNDTEVCKILLDYRLWQTYCDSVQTSAKLKAHYFLFS